MSEQQPVCQICGEPMPEGEEMFKMHGYSGPCPKPSINFSVTRPLNLQWGENHRDGETHEEWHAQCGCAYHPEPFPHVHPCSEEHDRAAQLRSEVERLMEDRRLGVKYAEGTDDAPVKYLVRDHDGRFVQAVDFEALKERCDQLERENETLKKVYGLDNNPPENPNEGDGRPDTPPKPPRRPVEDN